MRFETKIALEVGDLNEYNQCQIQLEVLYDRGCPGHVDEFAAYRLLFLLLRRVKLLMAAELAKVDGTRLSSGRSTHSAVSHALEVRPRSTSDVDAIKAAIPFTVAIAPVFPLCPPVACVQVMKAVNTGNYHRFFLLYQATPNMGMCVVLVCRIADSRAMLVTAQAPVALSLRTGCV
jgi:hypothetical protein